VSAKTRLTRSAAPKLVALLDGVPAGIVYQTGNKRLVFQYDDAWRRNPTAYPLSLSMPLTTKEHGPGVVRPYLWGLLPDNPEVLEAWAHRYGVSRFDVIDILRQVGEDVAGAVQFALPDRVDELLGGGHLRDARTSIQWIAEDEVERRLRAVRLDPAAGRARNDSGQFSLAGMQSKTALYQSHDGRWGIPSGRFSTNRILKPPIRDLEHILYNEDFCLRLARTLKLPAAVSNVGVFGEEAAIVVERYDRTESGEALVRIHQEDMCQACGIPPTRRYEKNGGPGVLQIVELLRSNSTNPEQDVFAFLDANALNWLIAGTDAHAKNYSILHAPGPQLRLAPLYDLISVLPYPHLTSGHDTLAMSIGGEHRIPAITGDHWRTLARSIDINEDALTDRILKLGREISSVVEQVSRDSRSSPRVQEFTTKLGTMIVEHASARLRML
jgi:serine/threonine-protein kinase HipA